MLREFAERMDRRRQERRAAKSGRLEKRARAEALRREHQRENIAGKSRK